MTITKGSTVTIDTSGGAPYDVAALTDSLAIVFYHDSGDIRAVPCTVSGTTITVESADDVLVDSGPVSNAVVLACRLTDTSCLVVYDDSTNIEARYVTISGTTITVNSPSSISQFMGIGEIDRVSNTSAIFTYSTEARILSVSGTTVSFGTAESLGNTNPNDISICALSSSLAVAVWTEGDNSDRPEAVAMTISGSTLSAGTVKEIDTVAGSTFTRRVATKGLDATRAIFSYIGGGDYRLYVLSVSGTTITPGSVTAKSGGPSSHDISGNNSGGITLYAIDIGQYRVTEFSISGTTVTEEDTTTISDTPGSYPRIDKLSTTHSFGINSSSVRGTVFSITSGGTAATDEFGAAPMVAKPCDIDSDGTNIYIGVINSLGFPALIQFSTELDSDGSIVFEPGAGDNIGVQCGRKDADVIWIAGNFGGTDTVEKSEDAGASFSVKDDGSFDPVTSFAVGSDDDERVLIFTDAGGSVASTAIYETIDDGASWEQKNSGLGFVSKAVERLDINVEELVTGNESNAMDNIDYSPNSGEDLEDYSAGFPTQDVTSLVVG